jgi:hypothetical protein
MLKHEKIRALDNSMMFDRALETIVSGIRSKRPRVKRPLLYIPLKLSPGLAIV